MPAAAEHGLAGLAGSAKERAAEVLQTWQELVADAPNELTSLGRLLKLPQIPDIPEPLRGRAFALVEAAYEGQEGAGAELLRPLRALGPELDTFATIPVEGLSELHMDPPQPVPNAGDGMLLSEFPAEAVDELVAVAGAESGSPLLSVEVRQMGGRSPRPRPRMARARQSTPASRCSRSGWPWTPT